MSFDHEWHVCLNKYNSIGDDFRHWMYEGKRAHEESTRLIFLFQEERAGLLTKTHKQCSSSKEIPVENNHLTCCLGTKCADCPHLAAIESGRMSDLEKDTAKAWTCVSHILHSIGSGQHIDTSEGYLQTVDDRMFWEGV